MLKKKIWANFQRIIELFTLKIVTKLSKIWVWDPGSGKNLFRIPDPGIKKAQDPGSGSATLVRIRIWIACTNQSIFVSFYLLNNVVIVVTHIHDHLQTENMLSYQGFRSERRQFRMEKHIWSFYNSCIDGDISTYCIIHNVSTLRWKGVTDK